MFRGLGFSSGVGVSGSGVGGFRYRVLFRVEGVGGNGKAHGE